MVLLEPGSKLLVGNQTVEDCQDLFAVLVDALELGLRAAFVAMPEHHLIQEFAGDVDIAAQGVGGVAAQEQPVEKSRFPLGSQWIELFHRLGRLHNFSSISREGSSTKTEV